MTPTSSRSWFSIKAEKEEDEEAEVMIYDYIGAFGVTANSFVSALRKVNAKRINLAMNTPGGDCFDGIAIYNALKEHDADIHVRIDGLAASIGSIIAMAGDTISIAPNAYLMIHNPWSIAVGDADEMRRNADLLDKLTNTLAQTYAARSEADPEEIEKMMDEETWLTGEEAVAIGLADELTEEKEEEEKPAAAQYRPAAYVRNLDRVPAALRARLDLKPMSAIHGQNLPARAGGVKAAAKQEQPMNAQTFKQYAADNPESAEVKDLIAQGHKAGFAEGANKVKADLDSMLAAFPDDAKFAVAQFRKGRTVDEARDIKSDIDAATAQAKAEADAAKETARKATERADAQGPLTLGSRPEAVATGDIETDAKAEYAADSKLQAQFKSERNYVLYRQAQAAGNLNILKNTRSKE